jgi:hypothetical protein
MSSAKLGVPQCLMEGYLVVLTLFFHFLVHPRTYLKHTYDILGTSPNTYAVDGYMGASLHLYTTHAGESQILDTWGKAEHKQHCGIMVDAVNHC